jgi:hypothetical protein
MKKSEERIGGEVTALHGGLRKKSVATGPKIPIEKFHLKRKKWANTRVMRIYYVPRGRKAQAEICGGEEEATVIKGLLQSLHLQQHLQNSK